ncbi:MAG: protease modulator HflC [Pseudomonadota bacterium]
MLNFLKFLFAAIIIAGLVLAYNSIFVVDVREKVLVVRFGEIQRTIKTPGLNFKIPFVEDLVVIDNRLFVMESLDKSVQVVDGRRYVVDAVTIIKIVDPQKFRETVQASEASARDRIETRIDSALRQTYGKRTFDAALSKDRIAMMNEIRDQIRPQALSLGLEIVDVRIRRTDLRPEVLTDTFERMNAERFAEAEQLRAVGVAKREQIKAEAERQAIEMVAKAQRDSEIIRGEGDALRNNIFADAFNRDPEFFAFYRSMQAYPKSLDGKDTTLILTPDSEFFRYLKNPSGKLKK